MMGLMHAGRRRGGFLALAALLLALPGCTAAPLVAAGSGTATAAPATTTAPAVPVTELPADGAKDVSPTAPVAASVTTGTLHDVVLTNRSGTKVEGAMSPGGNSWATTE
ncbi:MAG: Ig-like domain-containing protein, partial [Mycobacteriaceae bacterium]